MKKFLLLSFVLAVAFILSSCKGDTGPSGASGTIFKAEFQYLVEPTAYSLTADAMIAESFPTYNYGGCGSAVAGNGGSGADRAVFFFDISGISPANVTVDSAYLTLFVSGMSSSAVTVTAYALDTTWYEGTLGCSGAASSDAHWTSFSPGGGDCNSSTVLSTNSVARTATAPDKDDPVSLKLNATTVKNWITNPSSNKGIIVMSRNEAAVGFISFHTKENLNGVTYNPKLTVYYELP